MCQSFSLCKGMAAAAKVFSNSYSHPKEAKDCFLCMCILEASSGTQAVTSSASGLSISLEPQVFNVEPQLEELGDVWKKRIISRGWKEP